MSGRARHWRDGELVTNRKTDRRQRKARPVQERLQETNSRCTKRFKSGWRIRLGFWLPNEYRGFVSDGPHGIGVDVWKGFVHVSNGSSDECFMSAANFLATIAKGRPSFSRLAILTSIEAQERPYFRNLTVVNGALVVSAPSLDPRVYEGRA